MITPEQVSYLFSEMEKMSKVRQRVKCRTNNY